MSKDRAFGYGLIASEITKEMGKLVVSEVSVEREGKNEGHVLEWNERPGVFEERLNNEYETIVQCSADCVVLSFERLASRQESA
jgi:hypothetical protein